MTNPTDGEFIVAARGWLDRLGTNGQLRAARRFKVLLSTRGGGWLGSPPRRGFTFHEVKFEETTV
jgi:hypothetical protein